MSYYAPFYRPTNYYNASVPQEMQNMQNGQSFGQPYGQPFNQPNQQTQMQQQPQPQMAMPTPSNDMIFVLNETEATAYPVAPNCSVTLWDKNKETVYIKSVSMQGVPSMRILDYTERTADNVPKTPEKHVCQCGKDFVHKNDFEALQSEFRALRNELDDLKAKPKAKNTKTVKSEDENDG